MHCQKASLTLALPLSLSLTLSDSNPPLPLPSSHLNATFSCVASLFLPSNPCLFLRRHWHCIALTTPAIALSAQKQTKLSDMRYCSKKISLFAQQYSSPSSFIVLSILAPHSPPLRSIPPSYCPTAVGVCAQTRTRHLAHSLLRPHSGCFPHSLPSHWDYAARCLALLSSSSSPCVQPQSTPPSSLQFTLAWSHMA